jgi:hypothetical protein
MLGPGTTARTFALVAGACAVACGTRTGLLVDARVDDATAVSLDGPSGSQACSSREPQKHRLSGSLCPGQRGPGASGPGAECPPDAGLPVACWQDSDCTAGSNGRCFTYRGYLACMGQCTYDACGSDSDCPGDVPCDCRPSESSSAANVCVTASNCRVDSDCGPCGYCSPSQVGARCFCPSTALCPDGGGACYVGTASGWQEVPCECGDACGHGYFCHTPRDTCIDDSDCVGDGTCNYDTVNKMWSCSLCWPMP